MKLSKEFKHYANELHWKKCRKIIADSKHILKELKVKNINEREIADFTQKVKNTIGFVESIINSYISAFKKEGIIIDEQDRSEIHQEIQGIIKNGQTELFRIGQGMIGVIRNEWSQSVKESMSDDFKSKVIEGIEQTLAHLDIAISKGIIKKMLEQNKNRQYAVLRWIFDKANGSQNELIDLLKLSQEDKNYQYDDLEKISDYLEGENLIRRPIDEGIFVQITHKGIKEIQSSINNPQKSTDHFSSTTINNFGDNYGVINQQAGINNTQINTSKQTNDIEQKIKELIEAVKNSQLSEFQKITTESDLQTIQKLTRVEITPEVSQEVQSRIASVKDVLSTTADLVSLGQIVLPIIGHFFHIANF